MVSQVYYYQIKRGVPVENVFEDILAYGEYEALTQIESELGWDAFHSVDKEKLKSLVDLVRKRRRKLEEQRSALYEKKGNLGL